MKVCLLVGNEVKRQEQEKEMERERAIEGFFISSAFRPAV